MIEQHQNALKTNSGWLSLVDRAQGETERIARYLLAKERLLALAPEAIRAKAEQYLDPARALQILVLPEGVNPPVN